MKKDKKRKIADDETSEPIRKKHKKEKKESKDKKSKKKLKKPAGQNGSLDSSLESDSNETLKKNGFTNGITNGHTSSSSDGETNSSEEAVDPQVKIGDLSNFRISEGTKKLLKGKSHLVPLNILHKTLIMGNSQHLRGSVHCSTPKDLL